MLKYGQCYLLWYPLSYLHVLVEKSSVILSEVQVPKLNHSPQACTDVEKYRYINMIAPAPRIKSIHTYGESHVRAKSHHAHPLRLS